MIPVMAFAPVLAPLRVRLVTFAPVETPVTAPMLRSRVARPDELVKLAAPPSPWISIAELMVSVWAPVAPVAWTTPPLLNLRLPPLSV